MFPGAQVWDPVALCCNSSLLVLLSLKVIAYKLYCLEARFAARTPLHVQSEVVYALYLRYWLRRYH